jgi:hypothetical protein
MCVEQPSGPSRRLSASRKNKNKKKGETIKQKGERKERKKRNA